MKFVCQITQRIMTHDQETVCRAPDASFHTIFTFRSSPSIRHTCDLRNQNKNHFPPLWYDLGLYLSIVSQMPSTIYLIFSIHFIAACRSRSRSHNSKWLRWFLHVLILLRALESTNKKWKTWRNIRTMARQSTILQRAFSHFAQMSLSLCLFEECSACNPWRFVSLLFHVLSNVMFVPARCIPAPFCSLPQHSSRPPRYTLGMLVTHFHVFCNKCLDRGCRCSPLRLDPDEDLFCIIKSLPHSLRAFSFAQNGQSNFAVYRWL